MLTKLRTMALAGTAVLAGLLGIGAGEAKAQLVVATPGLAVGVGPGVGMYPGYGVYPGYPAYPGFVPAYRGVYPVRPYPYRFGYPGVYAPRPFYGPYGGVRPFGYRRW